MTFDLGEHPCCQHCRPDDDWHRAGPGQHVVPCRDCTRHTENVAPSGRIDTLRIDSSAAGASLEANTPATSDHPQPRRTAP